MASKTGILCVDFGTSSTRAAILEDSRQRPRPLELGEAVRSSIDRASIPSAVFVSADCSEILFGEQALSKGLRGEKSSLFETSPKRWMTADSPTILDDELFEGTGEPVPNVTDKVDTGDLVDMRDVVATAVALVVEL